MGRLEVLTISEEDWSTLQHRLAFPLPVVSVRRVEEDTQAGWLYYNYASSLIP